MPKQNNPYAAPSARVADAVPAGDDGTLIEGGQSVAAGRGWAWIKEGYALFRESPGTWVLIIFVMALILIAIGLVPYMDMLSSLVVPVFTGGLLLGCRALARGDELEFGYLFEGFRSHAKPLLLVGLLYLAGLVALGFIAAVVFGVGYFVGGEAAADSAREPLGFLLVVLIVVALSIPLVMAVWFAPALVVFHEFGPLAAMKQSFSGCLRNIPAFLVYGLIGMLLAILASIPAMLGWLVLGPVFTGSLYASYRDIFLKS
ncbi:MAG: BPSS1780 family membrane protein [Pseudomonadota bacterium]